MLVLRSNTVGELRSHSLVQAGLGALVVFPDLTGRHFVISLLRPSWTDAVDPQKGGGALGGLRGFDAVALQEAVFELILLVLS